MGLLGGLIGGLTGGLKNAVEATVHGLTHTVSGVTQGAQTGAAGGSPLPSIPGLPNLGALPATLQKAASTPHPTGNGSVLDHFAVPALAGGAGLLLKKIPWIGGMLAALAVTFGMSRIHSAMHTLEQPYTGPAPQTTPAPPPGGTTGA